MWIGYADTSSFITNAIQTRWARKKSPNFLHIWLLKNKSPHRLRIRLSRAPVSLSAGAGAKTRLHRQRPARHPAGKAARRLHARRSAHRLAHLKGDYRLMAELLYGSGLRLMECVRLRVKDIDFGYSHITVRDGKGLRDRVTILPERLRRTLCFILSASARFIDTISARRRRVYLPFALERKYPQRGMLLGWQYAFPSRESFPDPRSGETASSPRLGEKPAKGGQNRDSSGPESARLPAATLPAQFCHTSLEEWIRYSHRAGTARPQRRVHDDDLHPCAEPARSAISAARLIEQRSGNKLYPRNNVRRKNVRLLLRMFV